MSDVYVDPGYSFVHKRGKPVVRLRYGGQDILLVATREHVRAALTDPATFSSQHELPNGSSAFLGVMTPPTPIRAVPIELDPPRHTEFRKALASFFRVSAVQAMTPEILEYTTWCIDQHVEEGSMDLFHDLAKLVPAMLTMRLLGLPIEDACIVADGVHAMSEDRFALSPTWVVLIRATMDAVRERRESPREDLISHLVSLRIDGEPLSDGQLFEVCFTMIVGGMSTTARLLLGALSYLGRAGEDRERLAKNLELIPDSLEEFLRYYSPVPILCRTATHDLEFGGVSIPKGARVGMGFAAANRDPEAFDRPDEICLDSPRATHLALGHGPHHCIGGMLGRLEARIVLEETFRRLPDWELDAEKIKAHATPVTGITRARGMTWAERVERGLPATFSPAESLHALDGFALRGIADHLQTA